MQKAKKVEKKSRRHEMIDAKTENLVPMPASPTFSSKDLMNNARVRWIALVVVVLVVLGAYLGSRGFIVAALVNGKPIFRWDLNQSLATRFGQQTLESMISERLIADTAQQKGVVISKEDVTTKMNDLVKTLGPDVKLDDLLKYQGMTKTDFENQIRLQLTVEKILGKDVAVADTEVDDFIAKNRTTMTATGEAELRGEARSALESQKVSEKIQPWFAELKQKAKIIRLFK